MSINEKTFPISVKGHVKITDDLGNVLLDKNNAIHPQNMARVIARALANENNFYIHRIAFGNGGTIVDAAGQITYKTPNDGQVPDVAEWKSSLYNETYSEIIDERSVLIGSGPGTSPQNDPSSGPGVRSEEHGLISKVIIECVLNPFEPTGQTSTDVLSPIEGTEDAFVFDEIGLYTSGAPHVATSGYQDVNVNTKFDVDDTGLAQNTTYTFNITVDGGTQQSITFNTGTGSGIGGAILYSDLVNLINSQLVGAVATISDKTGTVNTYGKLRFRSNSTGSSSTIIIEQPTTPPNNWLFQNLVGYLGVESPVNGQDEGNKNNPTTPEREGERLLAHIIFSPVRKSANRVLTIVYTLTIQVERSTF